MRPARVVVRYDPPAIWPGRSDLNSSDSPEPYPRTVGGRLVVRVFRLPTPGGPDARRTGPCRLTANRPQRCGHPGRLHPAGCCGTFETNRALSRILARVVLPIREDGP